MLTVKNIIDLVKVKVLTPAEGKTLLVQLLGLTDKPSKAGQDE